MNTSLFSYIDACPTAFHTVAHSAHMLAERGYICLHETEDWQLSPKQGYFVTRNGSSLIAFRTPDGDFDNCMIAAAHGDAPCFKIKENADMPDQAYVRLSSEKYGGMLCATWMDRPLSIAGRVTVRTEEGLTTRLVDLGHGPKGRHMPQALIPSVAIHMNRAANESASYNAASDMIPLAGDVAHTPRLRQQIADTLGLTVEDILTMDLYLYNPQPGVEWSGLISAPRLDDLQCAFSCLRGFMDAGQTDRTTSSLPILCLFDNEEVGSQTRQGAASTFLYDVLSRIAEAMHLTAAGLQRRLASSFMLSCDNGHALHPNHPEFADKNHTVHLNKGVVIKYNASQRYTSDALSAALFQCICDQAGVPYQRYANRADMPGGSTLGNISGTQVSVPTVDIGLAQLAMHSCFETAGAEDTACMVKALTAFFDSQVQMREDGCYTVRTSV